MAERRTQKIIKHQGRTFRVNIFEDEGRFPIVDVYSHGDHCQEVMIAPSLEAALEQIIEETHETFDRGPYDDDEGPEGPGATDEEMAEYTGEIDKDE